MTDIIPTRALGKCRQYIEDVEATGADNFIVHAWVAGGVTDNDIRDAGTGSGAASVPPTVAAIELVGSVTEATPYTPQTFDDPQITITIDDVNDQYEADFSDVVFTAVAAQTAWSNVTVAYSAAGTDVDSSNEVIWWLDAVVTPAGGDITLQFPVPFFTIVQAP